MVAYRKRQKELKEPTRLQVGPFNSSVSTLKRCRREAYSASNVTINFPCLVSNCLSVLRYG